MHQKHLNIVIVGCGNVASQYAEQVKAYPEVHLLGFADMLPERASEFSKKYGGKAYGSLEAVLADDTVNIIINLTIHFAHKEVITKCLEAGKHVHSEKPLAMNAQDAYALAALAKNKHLRLSCAPITFMGEAQRQVAKQIEEHKIGDIRLIYAEINHGRIEFWHPNPGPFYEVGILWDVAIYPITLLHHLFGNIKSVSAFGKVLWPERKKMNDEPFTITTPEYVCANLELERGITVRLSSNFYGLKSKQGSSVEFHGDRGSLYLESSFMFNAGVELAEDGEDFHKMPQSEAAFKGIEFGRGVQALAQSMISEEPHEATAEAACHVIAVIEAINQSIKSGKNVSVLQSPT